jgi:hypothetical protein
MEWFSSAGGVWFELLLDLLVVGAGGTPAVRGRSGGFGPSVIWVLVFGLVVRAGGTPAVRGRSGGFGSSVIWVLVFSLVVGAGGTPAVRGAKRRI